MTLNKPVKIYNFHSKAIADEIKKESGFSYLLGFGADSKTVKGRKLNFETGILYLLPDFKLCPASKSAGCAEPCLVTAGRAAFDSRILTARYNRSDLFHKNPELFFSILVDEIERKIKALSKTDKTLVIRLNGTSDIDFENYPIIRDGFFYNSIFELFPNVQFYDYTKRAARLFKAEFWPSNYHMTLSYSEFSDGFAKRISSAAQKFGLNMAVVFNGELPKHYKGFSVISGDDTDLRFLDPSDKTYIVGLKAKGKAKRDFSGFTVQLKISA